MSRAAEIRVVAVGPGSSRTTLGVRELAGPVRAGRRYGVGVSITDQVVPLCDAGRSVCDAVAAPMSGSASSELD